MKRLITICLVVGMIFAVASPTFAVPTIVGTGSSWAYTAGGGFNDVGFALTKKWDARARANSGGGWEIAVGEDVAVAGLNDNADMTWLVEAGAYTEYGFSLAFSGNTATLSIIDGPSVSYSGLVAPTDLYLQAKSRTDGVSMIALVLDIDGTGLGNLSIGPNEIKWIHIGGLPTGSFTLTGTLFGNFDQAVSEKLAFDMIAAVPEPATIALLGIGSLALLRRKRRA